MQPKLSMMDHHGISFISSISAGLSRRGVNEIAYSAKIMLMVARAVRVPPNPHPFNWQKGKYPRRVTDPIIGPNLVITDNNPVRKIRL